MSMSADHTGFWAAPLDYRPLSTGDYLLQEDFGCRPSFDLFADLHHLLHQATGDVTSHPYVYLSTGALIVRRGIIYDLASIPRILWGWFAPQDIDWSATIHDGLYLLIKHLYHADAIDHDSAGTMRHIADRIFRDCLDHEPPSIPEYKRNLAYYAVRGMGGEVMFATIRQSTGLNAWHSARQHRPRKFRP